jgi:hypothetical protein
MLQNIKELYGSKLTALDGDVGHAKDFYFDDKAWVIRYLVADTGSWLTGRLVLIAPHAFARWDHFENSLRIKLRKKQIEDSPSIDTHEPVSRQFEEGYYRSYGWPAYWEGGQMWGLSAFPYGSASPLPRDLATRKALEPRADRHLQSARTVTGYAIEASDGTIGRLSGFLVNDMNWAISDLVVETGHWYAGKEILISPDRVSRIGYVESKVFVNLTIADIQATAENELVRAGAGGGQKGTFSD